MKDGPLVTVVTGGTSGVGKAVCELLSTGGDRTFILCSRTEPAQPLPFEHHWLPLDLSDPASVTRCL